MQHLLEFCVRRVCLHLHVFEIIFLFVDLNEILEFGINLQNSESTIMLRESSQDESSVMRLRLEGCKKPIRGHKKPIMNMHQRSKYALTGGKYALAGSKYTS